MNSEPLALSSHLGRQPIMPRVASRRIPPQHPPLAQGQLKVLQSSRAPAQMSLFERPCGGR